MRLITEASELITMYNGDIEAIANHCMTSILVNRILTIGIIICIYIIRKRKKNNFYTLDGENDAKLKKISNWENRTKHDQVKHIIKQYIEHYTRVNKINWDEYR